MRSPEVAERSRAEGAIWENAEGDIFTLSETLDIHEIRSLWIRLDNLGRVYEEICREWFLPTYLGAASSY
jgi:hypothetical protein